jgi:GST-like protein
MWQMGGFGPMLGQAHHFMNYAPEKIEYAINRYANEAKRLYGVLDRQLAKHKHVAGSQYSIADMAIWPWARSHKNHRIDLAEFPHVGEWFERVGKRPAVQRAVQVLAAERSAQGNQHSPQAWNNLFGAEQFKKR